MIKLNLSWLIYVIYHALKNALLLFTLENSQYLNMLVLYETAMGYCLFKLSDSAKLDSADLYKEFETPEKANKLCVDIMSLS